MPELHYKPKSLFPSMENDRFNVEFDGKMIGGV